jgi:BirA family transcriptional regulator, biotin operon repressor / biotin---[acetyl-CoA-carboxylase] ligase
LESFGIKPDIKWVNDVLVNEKKIAGILAEATETDRGLAVVVGVGINLTSANFPRELLTTATSIADILRTPVSRDELIDGLTKHLGIAYALLQKENGPAKVIANWTKRSSYSSGKAVRAVLESEIVTGVTDGLDTSGALRIKRGDETTVIVHAGDVEQVRAAV